MEDRMYKEVRNCIYLEEHPEIKEYVILDDYSLISELSQALGAAAAYRGIEQARFATGTPVKTILFLNYVKLF